ncbi:hypothetical protein ZWY2020_041581 [Hordeum vulgare]|nr:hypothetical protein ZWY2020_041581 [Hordeum vulgare]
MLAELRMAMQLQESASVPELRALLLREAGLADAEAELALRRPSSASGSRRRGLMYWNLSSSPGKEGLNREETATHRLPLALHSDTEWEYVRRT